MVVFLTLHPMVFIFPNSSDLLEHLAMFTDDFSTRNTLLTKRVLKQGCWYHKIVKTLFKLYRQYFDLISQFNIGLKSLLRQGISQPELYGDLVYKLKKTVGLNKFSAQFIK